MERSRVKLGPGAAGIFDEVLAAMQNAEELGGPDAPDYCALMDAIAAEATRRAATCRAMMAPEEV